jgi:hypothetical protein
MARTIFKVTEWIKSIPFAMLLDCYAFEASHREQAKVLKHAESNDPWVIAPFF